MKKVAYISDIHGNLEALLAAMDDIKSQKIHDIYILGDMVGDCANPKQVLKFIRDNKLIPIMGNREQLVLDIRDRKLGDISGISQIAPMVWTYEQLDKPELLFIESMPKYRQYSINGKTNYINHGSPKSISELVHKGTNQRLWEIMKGVGTSFYGYGHTHQCWQGKIRGQSFLNPGSLGLPYIKMGYSHYAVVEYTEKDINIEKRVIKYDVQKTINKIRQNMSEETGPWSKGIICSLITGKNISLDFIKYAFNMAKEMGSKEYFIPNDIFALADKKYDWPLDV